MFKEGFWERGGFVGGATDGCDLFWKNRIFGDILETLLY